MVQFSAPRGHPLPISERAEVCMGQNFKLLLEGWCLQQSCRVGQGDNEYAKILWHALTRGQKNKKIGTDEPNYGKVNSTFPAVLHFFRYDSNMGRIPFEPHKIKKYPCARRKDIFLSDVNLTSDFYPTFVRHDSDPILVRILP
jgi:hypothetical protein